MLRDYQVACIGRVRAAVRALRAAGRPQRVCVVSPCGSGKTRIHAHIAAEHVARGGFVLWLVAQTELADQSIATLKGYGLVVGAICPSSIYPPQPHARVQVATVQTIHRRSARPKATLIICDEAHFFVAKTLRGILDDYPDAIVLGPTATPDRSDGRGLGEVFEEIVIAATVRQLLDRSEPCLVPTNLIRPGRKLRRGEIAQRPVDAYLQHARGRRNVVFSPRVSVAQEHADQFKALGVPAAMVCDATPWGERRDALKALGEGRILALTQVGIATYGLDIPAIDCVTLARGFDHQGGFLQAIGRGQRLSPATGKRDLIVLDLNGVSWDFGHPEDDRTYDLGERGISCGSGGASDPVVVQAYCKVCSAALGADDSVCPVCGTVAAAAPQVVTGDKLLPYQVALRRDPPDKRAQRFARWLMERKTDGTPKKEGSAVHKYKAVYGESPPAEVLASAEVRAARAAVREAAEAMRAQRAAE